MPDGTEEVRSWGASGVTVVLENGEEQASKAGVPVGKGLDGRRLLGKFVPYGAFVAEAGEVLRRTRTWRRTAARGTLRCGIRRL